MFSAPEQQRGAPTCVSRALIRHCKGQIPLIVELVVGLDQLVGFRVHVTRILIHRIRVPVSQYVAPLPPVSKVRFRFGDMEPMDMTRSSVRNQPPSVMLYDLPHQPNCQRIGYDYRVESFGRPHGWPHAGADHTLVIDPHPGPHIEPLATILSRESASRRTRDVVQDRHAAREAPQSRSSCGSRTQLPRRIVRTREYDECPLFDRPSMSFCRSR